MSNDNFWFNDIGILFQQDKLTDFFPDNKMSLEEKLNSISRLSFYISILLFVYNKNYNNIYIFLITLLITYFIYNYADKKVNKLKEHLHQKDNDNFLKYFQPKKICKPSVDNPFCNITLDEYQDNPNRDTNINVNDKEIMQDIDNKFNHNLYCDVNDIWNKNNSQRQFMTNPIKTIPNDQHGFAQWLYGKSDKHCKEGNGNDCYTTIDTPLNGQSRLPMI